MARIGIDLDGVLYNFGAALREYLKWELGWPVKLIADPITKWTFYRDWGLTDEGFVAVCDMAADAGKLWNKYEVLDTELQGLRALHNAGHTLHVITDRRFGKHPGVSQAATAQWLSRNKIPYDTLTFSRDKTIVATDYMIDDRLENYDALEATACVPFLRDRPWNQSEDRRRVDSVAEFAKIIIESENID